MFIELSLLVIFSFSAPSAAPTPDPFASEEFPPPAGPDNNECQFEPIGKFADLLAKVALPTRTLTDMIGMKANLTFPGIPTDFNMEALSELMPYLYSIAGFGVPFLLAFVILFLYFICGQLCMICCCKPTTTSKVTCKGATMAIISAVFMLVSIALFFVSASFMAKAVGNIKELPTEIKGVVGDVFGTVTNTMDSTVVFINNFLNDTEGKLYNFSNWMSTDGAAANTDAVLAKTKTDEYSKLFLDYTTTTGTTDKYDYKEPFKTDMNALNAAIQSSSLDNTAKGYYTAALTGFQYSTGAKAIEKVADELISASSSINQTTTEINKVIKDNIALVKGQVSTFSNGSLTQNIDSFQVQITKFTDLIDPIQPILLKVNSLIKGVTFGITAAFAAITILFFVVYFCNNGCSRCLACWFPCFGAILTLIIVLPAAIFAILFYVFYDLCPVLESQIDTMASGILPPGAIDNVLTCTHVEPLYDVAQLNTMFDYKKLIGDLTKDASDKLGNGFQPPPDLFTKLNDFGANFNIHDNVTSASIVFNHSLLLKEIIEKAPDTRTSAVEVQKYINDTESKMEVIRQLMQNVLDFGNKIVPTTNATQDMVKNLVKNFGTSAVEKIDSGFGKLTCNTVKCVYKDPRNALCSNLLSGMSFWILSSVFTMIGTFVLGFSYCSRRKGMKKPEVEGSSDYSDEYTESSSSQRRNKKK